MADIFNDDNGDDQTIDPNRDYLAEYVGEGKKFKDERELARAKAEADAHIARIEAENREYRERAMQSKSVEDLMTQINERLTTRQDPPNHGSENDQEKTGTSVSPEDLDKLISEKLTAKQREEQAKTNQAYVLKQLQDKFGQDYGRKVQAAASELGLTKEEMTALAQERPKAFLKLVGDAQGQTPGRSFSPPDNRFNTQADNSSSGTKTMAYYRKLRKDNPKLYQSTRVQAEMHREAIKQGAAFFD